MIRYVFSCLILLSAVSVFSQEVDSVSSEIPFFMEYKVDSTLSVRKARDVKFYREGVDGLLLKEVNFSIDSLDGREEYFNQLSVYALEEKTHYKTERWKIRANNERPKGLYDGEYYVSVIYGCCGAEDEYQLYSLKTGRKMISATLYKACNAPFSGMYAYSSPNTVNEKISFPKGVLGELTLVYNATRSGPAKVLKIQLMATNGPEYTEYTPDINVMFKEEVKKKSSELYPKIEKINAKYFMVLNYFDECTVIIPFDNDIPLLSSAVSTHPAIKLGFKK